MRAAHGARRATRQGMRALEAHATPTWGTAARRPAKAICRGHVRRRTRVQRAVDGATARWAGVQGRGREVHTPCARHGRSLVRARAAGVRSVHEGSVGRDRSRLRSAPSRPYPGSGRVAGSHRRPPGARTRRGAQRPSRSVHGRRARRRARPPSPTASWVVITSTPERQCALTDSSWCRSSSAVVAVVSDGAVVRVSAVAPVAVQVFLHSWSRSVSYAAAPRLAPETAASARVCEHDFSDAAVREPV
jgi:hypothetical protein